MTDRDKHPRLLQYVINYGRKKVLEYTLKAWQEQTQRKKSFMMLTPEPDIIKLFKAVIYKISK